MPNHFNDRVADIVEPLIAIADVAGGTWRERLIGFLNSRDIDMDDDSIGVLLLGDIQAIFDERNEEEIHSTDLAQALSLLDDRPWSDWKNGKAITTHALAKLLNPFEIKPDQIKINKINKNGYEIGQFKDVFDRYLKCICA